MKLSKPEEMDEMEEPVEEQSGGDRDAEPTVEVFDEEMALSDGVRLLGEVVEDPAGFGLVGDEEVRDLRERLDEQRELIEEQERAIAELADAVEVLSGLQAESTGQAVCLDGAELGGIYDPTEEF